MTAKARNRRTPNRVKDMIERRTRPVLLPEDDDLRRAERSRFGRMAGTHGRNDAGAETPCGEQAKAANCAGSAGDQNRLAPPRLDAFLDDLYAVTPRTESPLQSANRDSRVFSAAACAAIATTPRIHPWSSDRATQQPGHRAQNPPLRCRLRRPYRRRRSPECAENRQVHGRGTCPRAISGPPGSPRPHRCGSRSDRRARTASQPRAPVALRAPRTRQIRSPAFRTAAPRCRARWSTDVDTRDPCDRARQFR